MGKYYEQFAPKLGEPVQIISIPADEENPRCEVVIPANADELYDQYIAQHIEDQDKEYVLDSEREAKLNAALEVIKKFVREGDKGFRPGLVIEVANFIKGRSQ